MVAKMVVKGLEVLHRDEYMKSIQDGINPNGTIGIAAREWKV